MVTEHFRVLISRQEDMFVAQCLEHDVAVQAPDLETLERRFDATIAAESADGSLASIPPAPAQFHEIWDQAAELTGHFPHSQSRVAA